MGIFSRKRKSAIGGASTPDVIAELGKLRLEQAKTNDLLLQILVPLAFISSCCSATLRHVQRLASSCSSAASLLEDCSRDLRAIVFNTAHTAALLATGATLTAYDSLLNEHDLHTRRGMHVAAAACLMADLLVALPHRWRTCRPAPGGNPVWDPRHRHHHPPPHGSLFGLWSWRLRLPQSFIETWSNIAGSTSSLAPSAQPAAPLRSGAGWFYEMVGASWLGTGAAVAPGAQETEQSWWFRSTSTNMKSIRSSSSWSWWWLPSWEVGSREASVLLCRARLTVRILAGALILVLWYGLQMYLAVARHRQTPRPGLASASITPSNSDHHDTKDGNSPRVQGTLLEGQAQRKVKQPTYFEALTGTVAAGVACMRPVAGGGRVMLLSRGLLITMWRHSASLFLVHSIAWLSALAAMGGSSSVWLVLQLVWHVGMPYAIVAFVSADNPRDDCDAIAGAGPTCAATAKSYRRSANQPVGHIGMYDAYHVIVEGEADRQRGRGNPVHDALAQDISHDGVGKSAVLGTVATSHKSFAATIFRRKDVSDYDLAVERKAAYEHGYEKRERSCPELKHSGLQPFGDSSEPFGGNEADDEDEERVSGRDSYLMGCGLFNLRAKFGLGSKSRHRGSHFGLRRRVVVAGVNATSVSSISDGTMPVTPSGPESSSITAPAAVAVAAVAAATGAVTVGPGGSGVLRPTSGMIPVPAKRKPRLAPFPGSCLTMPPASFAAAVATISTWVSVSTLAGWFRPLLAALWLYGGPVLLGTLPVLPFPWLWDQLMVSSLLIICLALIGAMAIMVLPIGSSPGLAAASAEAPPAVVAAAAPSIDPAISPTDDGTMRHVASGLVTVRSGPLQYQKKRETAYRR